MQNGSMNTTRKHTKKSMADFIDAKSFKTNLSKEHWTLTSEGLTRRPQDGKVFAISYELFCSLGDVYVEPAVYAWEMREGTIFRHPLSDTPDMAMTFATQAFSFLAWDSLRLHAINAIDKILPKDASETYSFAITPDGAVLVAEEWHSVRYSNGAEAVACALPASMDSNHTKLKSLTNLAATINALVAFQEQYGSERPSIPEFRLSA